MGLGSSGPDTKTRKVYVRENGNETLPIEDTESSSFLTASADGSKVLLSDGHLYDVENQKLEDLTAKKGKFVGLVGASEDLSRIYFVDMAVLASGGIAEHANLYLWEESGPVRFVARLDGGGEAYPTSLVMRVTGRRRRLIVRHR